MGTTNFLKMSNKTVAFVILGLSSLVCIGVVILKFGHGKTSKSPEDLIRPSSKLQQDTASNTIHINPNATFVNKETVESILNDNNHENNKYYEYSISKSAKNMRKSHNSNLEKDASMTLPKSSNVTVDFVSTTPKSKIEPFVNTSAKSTENSTDQNRSTRSKPLPHLNPNAPKAVLVGSGNNDYNHQVHISGIYNFEVFGTGSDIDKTYFFCSIKDSSHPCPNYMQIYAKLSKTRLQYHHLRMMEHGYHLMNYGDYQLFFSHNSTIVYTNSSMKWSQGLRLTDKNTFYHEDEKYLREPSFYDWFMNNIGSLVKATCQYNFTDIDTIDTESSILDCYCPEDENIPKSQSICSNRSRNFDHYWNWHGWIAVLFGLNSQSESAILGNHYDQGKDKGIEDKKAIGVMKSNWSRRDVPSNIIEYHDQEQRWCDCMKRIEIREGQLIQSGKDANFAKECFDRQSVRKEFQIYFQYDLCNLEFERIKKGI